MYSFNYKYICIQEKLHVIKCENGVQIKKIDVEKKMHYWRISRKNAK